MIKRLDPTDTSMTDTFVTMEPRAYCADPVNQSFYEQARWELERQETD